MTDDELVIIGFALLQAAIVAVDIADAMPVQQQLAMPEDISGRLFAGWYQSAFDLLPPEIQAEARRRVEQDPHIVAARRIHAG
jgi:hypothetical protein